MLGEDRTDSPFVAMMSNGTSGDINNVDFRGGQPRLPPYERMERVATRVAAEVFKGLQHVAWRDHVSLAAAERTLTLQRRAITPEMAAWAEAALAATRRRAEAPARAIYAERIQGSAGAPPTLEVVLQAVRIGDLAIATFPFEVFVEIGLEIKAKSPFAQTFTTSLANGYDGYLPTKRQHDFGGYETWLGTNRVELDAARLMTDALLDMLATLRRDEDSAPPALIPLPRQWRSGRGAHIHSARCTTAPAPTSRCSPRWPSGSSCASSTRRAPRPASRCPR